MLCDSENDIIGIQSFLDQLIDTKFYNEVHWKEIWKNNRFEFIIRSSIHDSRIKDKIYQMVCQSSIPEYIPLDIAQYLKPFPYKENELQKFENFEQFKHILDKIVVEEEIPDNFNTILLESFKENYGLREKFEELGLLKLLQYDSKNEFFPEIVGIKTFSKIQKIISEYEFKEPDPQDFNHLYISFEDKTDFEIDYKNYVEEKEIQTCKNFNNSIFGKTIQKLNYEEYISMKKIQIKPELHEFNPQNYKESIVPFMIQKIKMWGCNALTPDKISKLMKKLDYQHNFNINDPFSNMVEGESDVSSPSIENSIMPLSRLDIIVGIFNSVDEIVAQDLLNNMAKFPQSLPLVISDLSEDDTYKVLMPWLTQPIIKWELRGEKVLENHMFLDNFKMIVTLRIGDSSKGRNGKSTLINSALKFQNVFSCCGEPRAINGKPSTLNGTVEYICLTKEISSAGLWQSFLETYYSSGKNQLLLLANLHGNSLDFTDTLLFLKSIATSFIVFIMPETLKDPKHDWNELIQIISSEPQNRNIFYIVVDPSPNCKYNENVILDSSKTADDNNLRKLRHVLKNAADFERKCFKKTDLKIGGKLKLAEPIETLQSENFMRFIENEIWRSIKTSLYLQKINSWENKSLIDSDRNRIQKEIISLMRHMLLLEIPSRIKAMVHLDKELNRISTQETELARDRFIKLTKDYYLNEEEKSESGEVQKFLINEACKEMDDNNFGSEHIYREIGKLFEFFSYKCLDNNPYSNSAKLYAELLIAGQALELLDGDSNSINDAWLSAICKNINQIKPNLRIFVISILGLQSSGKSTLLNALFGCKFAVSVGRCTRGLFIRLLFLDEIFRKENNIDAILLIDTEGLAALEKINEKGAEKKDRSMATLAMGISHLTIVNVKGENMNNLIEILQIAIVALTRLKIAKISPDLIIVQHLDEFNDERLATARIRFNEAVEKAFKIINKKNVDLGIINSDCLSQLKKTILSNKFFKSFHPLKNGSTINSPPSDEYHEDIVRLYCEILEIAKNIPNRTDFEKWSVLVQNFWDAVKKEDFMSFKGVMEIYEFLKKENLISKVKDAIESAYSKHHDELKGFVAEKVRYLIDNNMNSKQALNELKNKLHFVLDKCLSKCDECRTVTKTREELNEYVKLRSDKLDVNKTIINFIGKIKISKTESLTMMLEGKMTREIQSADILEQINSQLKEQLEKKKEGEYSPEEIQELTHKICDNIKKQKTKHRKVSKVEDQIFEEIKKVYVMNNYLVTEYENPPITTLKNLEAFHHRKYVKKLRTPLNYVHIASDLLSKKQVQKLEKEAEKLSATLLTEKNAEKYVPTMIQRLKTLVEKIIKDFESKEGGLREDFKHKFHLFAIKKFEIDMKKKQKEWNEKNDPLTIFCDMESKFENLIRQRLTIGYGFNSGGILAGKSLVAAIKNKSLQTANSYKISKIKDIGWLTSASNIRLKYFSELVEEVENKNLVNALNHFDEPQVNIEKWFKTVVDKYEIKDVFTKYKSNFEFELRKVIAEVESYDNFTNLKEYIENYVSANDAINYMSNNEADFTRDADNQNLDHFRNRIVDVMNSCEEKNPRETDLIFIKPSEEKSILERLGCTASCPLCSALCWGTRDHDEDEGEGHMHHTSHQPIGLSGIPYRSSLVLNSDPCHDQKHVKNWWYNDVKMKFKKMINLPKYKDWFYEPHPQKEFNDLMKWFFFRLHIAIAERNDVKPAREKHINYYDFKSLDIVKIMAKINNTLGINKQKML